MQHKNRWIIAVLVVAGLQLSACQRDAANPHSNAEPARVEHVGGAELSRVTLTQKAMERLGLETALVRQELLRSSAARNRMVVPYSALIYDGHGVAWVYTNPQAGTFVRHRIEVDYIADDMVVLHDGPSVGTVIATVGAAELYGAESAAGR
jgi:hypothetical protein